MGPKYNLTPSCLGYVGFRVRDRGDHAAFADFRLLGLLRLL